MTSRDVQVWAAAAEDGPGQCGSGRLISPTVVLTCRHVLDDYRKGGVLEVRQVGSGSQGWVNARVAWQSSSVDAALLEVTPEEGQVWTVDCFSTTFVSLVSAPTKCHATGWPDATERSPELRDPDHVSGKVLPGSIRSDSGEVAYDVSTSTPESAALWAGMSGAGLVDYYGRVAALIARVSPNREERRFFVVPVASFADDDEFLAKAEELGLKICCEHPRAPLWRRACRPEALGPSGTRVRIRDVTDWSGFSPRRGGTREGVGETYVPLDVDGKLDDAIAAAANGDRRLILVLGDSSIGKSRCASEALRRGPTRDWERSFPPVETGWDWCSTSWAIAITRPSCGWTTWTNTSVAASLSPC